MKNTFLLFALILWVMGCGADAPAAEDSTNSDNDSAPAVDLTIKPGEGFGDFTEETAKKDMVATLGKENLSDQAFHLGEGEMAPGLLVYPGTEKEIEVLLDEDGYPLIYRVRKADSEWRGPGGLRIGTTLAELKQINGGDFRLAGFGWDYGGTVTNWQGGALARDGFLVVVDVVGELNDMTPEDTEALMGDQEIASTLPALARYPIEVVRIEQRY